MLIQHRIPATAVDRPAIHALIRKAELEANVAMIGIDAAGSEEEKRHYSRRHAAAIARASGYRVALQRCSIV